MPVSVPLCPPQNRTWTAQGVKMGIHDERIHHFITFLYLSLYKFAFYRRGFAPLNSCVGEKNIFKGNTPN
jgi:hypothetical protein